MSTSVQSSYRRWRIGLAVGVLGALALVMAPALGRADEDDQGRKGRDKAEPAKTDIEKLEAKLAKQKADLEDTALKLKAALEAAKSAKETPKTPETPKAPEGRGRGETPKAPDAPKDGDRGRGFGFGGNGAPGGPGGFGRGGFGGGAGGAFGFRGAAPGGKSAEDIEKRLDAMIEELQQLRKDLKSATPEGKAPAAPEGERPGRGGPRPGGPGGERPGRGVPPAPAPDDAPAPPRGR
jgi:hypothetical protein